MAQKIEKTITKATWIYFKLVQNERRQSAGNIHLH